jgi:hypothetical protein
LFLPQRTRLIFVRHFRIGAGCLHVNGPFAMSAGTVTTYDFDPTTQSKKSGMTPVNQEECGGANRRGFSWNREGMYVVGADSRRAEIVWGL